MGSQSWLPNYNGGFMKAVCNTRSWDSETCRRFYPNREYDVDPLSPIAKYFNFPPGTKVYTKVRGTTRQNAKDPVEGTMVVPDGIDKEPEEVFECDCGFKAKSKAGYVSHLRKCEKIEVEKEGDIELPEV